jgi:hypothetical protein
MDNATAALARAEVLILARQRLWVHLQKVAELAGRGNIPAARVIADDDVKSDLDDIEGLQSELEAADAQAAELPAIGLSTLQFGREADGGYVVHLVRFTRRGTPGPTLCGIDRFAKDAPGWSVGGGTSGPAIVHTPCPGCAGTAREEFPGLKVTGLGAEQMAAVLGVPWSHWNGGRFADA